MCVPAIFLPCHSSRALARTAAAVRRASIDGAAVRVRLQQKHVNTFGLNHKRPFLGNSSAFPQFDLLTYRLVERTKKMRLSVIKQARPGAGFFDQASIAAGGTPGAVLLLPARKNIDVVFVEAEYNRKFTQNEQPASTSSSRREGAGHLPYPKGRFTLRRRVRPGARIADAASSSLGGATARNFPGALL